MRALLAGLTRLTLYGLVSYSCLSVTRWLGQTSFRAHFCALLRIEEICRSNYVDHGASIHSKGLTAGPLLREIYSHAALATEHRAQRRFSRSEPQ